MYTASPGIPGDSGSGFLSASGGAIGILSTVQIAPLAGSKGVGDLPKELAYARANGFFWRPVGAGNRALQRGRRWGP